MAKTNFITSKRLRKLFIKTAHNWSHDDVAKHKLYRLNFLSSSQSETYIRLTIKANAFYDLFINNRASFFATFFRLHLWMSFSFFSISSRHIVQQSALLRVKGELWKCFAQTIILSLHSINVWRSERFDGRNKQTLVQRSSFMTF